jgi:bile acid:Na+ symporter, BASS family
LLVRGLAADPMTIARPILFFVLLPLTLGTMLRGARTQAAERVRPAIALITNVAGGVVLVLIAVVHGRGLLDAIGSYAIATQVIFVAVITHAAYVLGFGLADDQRSVLTIGTCTRNLGAALAPLAAIDPDPRAVVMIAIAAPVTIALSVLAARVLSRRSRANSHAGRALLRDDLHDSQPSRTP